MSACIYVNRIVKVDQELPPAPEGVLNLIILSMVSLCTNYPPITFMIVMDILWRIYGKDQRSKISLSKKFCQIKGKNVIWSHPSEVHCINNQLTPEFWAWRKKVWSNPYPVRFPNGFNGKSECICALWSFSNENGEWRRYQYIEAIKFLVQEIFVEYMNP